MCKGAKGKGFLGQEVIDKGEGVRKVGCARGGVGFGNGERS